MRALAGTSPSHAPTHMLPCGLALTYHLSATSQRQREGEASQCRRISSSTRSSNSSYKEPIRCACSQLQDMSLISQSNFVEEAAHPALSRSRSPV